LRDKITGNGCRYFSEKRHRFIRKGQKSNNQKLKKESELSTSRKIIPKYKLNYTSASKKSKS